MTPASRGDVVYVGFGFGTEQRAAAERAGAPTVFALDRRTGRARWARAMGPIRDLAAGARAVFVRVSGKPPRVAALAASDGRERWSHQLLLHRVWCDAIADRFVCYGGTGPAGDILSFDQATGARRTCAQRIGAGGRFAGGRAYSIGRDPVLYADDLARAAPLWQRDLRDDALVAPGETWDLARLGDGVMVTTRTTVAAYDAAGTPRWSRAFPQGVRSPPVALVGSGLVLLASDGHLVALSAADGSERWRRAAQLAGDDAIRRSPLRVATRGGYAYVVEKAGVAAYQLETGAIRWRVAASLGIVARIGVRGDRVVVHEPDAERSVVRAFVDTDGSLAWTRELTGGADLSWDEPGR